MAGNVKEHLERHDRQIKAIENLLRAGMNMVIETRKDIRALTKAQKSTDASLKALIDGLRHSGNGKVKN